MLKVKTKFRLLSSLHMLIPVFIIAFFSRNATFFYESEFQIGLTICLGLILFNIMFSPLLLGLQWLFFKQIQQIVSLCSDIKHGRYRYFDIPNEPVEAGDENELIFLMRNMNWMVHQIERREELLERQVARRTRELETANAELVTARDAAKASSNAKSRFLATMSHEIRTPMNAIIGMSDLMLKAGLSPQMQEYAAIINTSSKDLLKIINDILDFSKIDAGKLDLEVVSVNVRNLMEEVADVFKHALAQKSVELITDIHENVPRLIKTDPLRLKQVMTNLVSNAVKFTHKGDVLIRVTAETKVDPDALCLKFSIQDTGIGMDQQAMDHLFSAFTQADESTSRKFGGTGLGLAISKNLVALMGGQISVTSTKGKGSCFSFTVHAQSVAESDALPVCRSSELSGRPVLLAVKNATTGRVLDGFLSSFGFDVTSAFGPLKNGDFPSSGRMPEKFDLMVLDLDLFEESDLPDIFTRASADALPPVIAIGAIGSGSALSRSPFIRTFISKPVRQSALFDSVMELFCTDKKASRPDPVMSCDRYALENTNVLLVEDNRINQTLAVEILKDQGVDTVVVGTGAQALELLQGQTFDAVLMDVGLPDMDGYEATRRIRQLETAKNIPVIAMTANALARDRSLGLEAGMNEYITKPVDAGILFRVLSDVLDKPVITDIRASESAGVENKADTMGELPGIDIKDAVKRLNGNQALLFQTVVDYARENQNTIPEIKKRMQNGNITDLLAAVHRFKGVSMNISAACLGRLLAEFEKKIKAEKETDEPDLMVFEADLMDITVQFELICRTAERLREKTDTVPEVAVPDSGVEVAGLVTPMVEKMGQLIKKNSLDAKAHAAALSKELENTPFAKDASTLALQIRRFDFPNARKTFERLEAALLKQPA